MKNFVLVSRFENSRAKEEFRKKVEGTFKHLKKQSTEEFTYYLIGEYNLPALEDTLNDFIHRIQLDQLIRTGDYVAVYFTDEGEPDLVKREMVFGKAEYVETDIKPTYKATHDAVIMELIEYNLLKHQA
jgi:hypothetical protein